MRRALVAFGLGGRARSGSLIAGLLGSEGDIGEPERGDGDGGGEQSGGGDQSPAAEPEIRREDGRGIEAERIQRIQRW